LLLIRQASEVRRSWRLSMGGLSSSSVVMFSLPYFCFRNPKPVRMQRQQKMCVKKSRMA
jgi:hypothetical protein